MARVLPLQGFRPSKGVVVSIIVQPEQMEKSTLHFNRKFFATRKSNPVQKISHLHFHTSGYYFCGPGGIRTHNQQNRNLSFYPIELRGRSLGAGAKITCGPADWCLTGSALGGTVPGAPRPGPWKRPPTSRASPAHPG